MGLKRVESKQIKLNKKLAKVLANNGISSLRITSVGNSIASGYSKVRTIKPLLLRNETIDDIMGNHNIVLVRKHFARAQNNNDEHIAGWLFRNIKESEIYEMNRVDYGDGPTKMPGKINGLNDELMDEYYPVDFQRLGDGLRDTILEDDPTLANIVIYNGCTGSFLDNVTRDGDVLHKFMYGIKRDCVALNSVLNYIQTSNRYSKTNTQIYICGAPNFLGLGVTNFINARLKKIAKSYANATYVKPAVAKLFYKGLESGSPLLAPDMHHDEVEYLRLNNHIISSIIDNYMLNRAMINMDRDLFHLSRSLELGNPFHGNDSYIKDSVFDSYTKQCSILASKDQMDTFTDKAKKYLKQRTPYDFHYIGKKNIDKVL